MDSVDSPLLKVVGRKLLEFPDGVIKYALSPVEQESLSFFFNLFRKG